MGEGGREMIGRDVKARVGWKRQVSQRAGEMVNWARESHRRCKMSEERREVIHLAVRST